MLRNNNILFAYTLSVKSELIHNIYNNPFNSPRFIACLTVTTFVIMIILKLIYTIVNVVTTMYKLILCQPLLDCQCFTMMTLLLVSSLEYFVSLLVLGNFIILKYIEVGFWFNPIQLNYKFSFTVSWTTFICRSVFVSRYTATNYYFDFRLKP